MGVLKSITGLFLALDREKDMWHLRVFLFALLGSDVVLSLISETSKNSHQRMADVRGAGVVMVSQGNIVPPRTKTPGGAQHRAMVSLSVRFRRAHVARAEVRLLDSIQRLCCAVQE